MNEVPWWSWLAGVLGLFLVFETWALLTRKPGDTLSERTRAWLGIQPRRWWAPAGAVGLLAFLVWFAGHILVSWPP